MYNTVKLVSTLPILDVPFLTFEITLSHQKSKGGGYEKAEESVETSTYYGGADACQGDSGGPLQVDHITCLNVLEQGLVPTFVCLDRYHGSVTHEFHI